jgi:predicted O-methyltransferase YrrM
MRRRKEARFATKKLKLITGSFQEEKTEQLMAVKYIKSTDVVLEIGGNIGRNSLVIASLLNDPKNLVVLESDPGSSGILKKHAELNNLSFSVLKTRGFVVDYYKGGGWGYCTNFFWQTWILPSN